MRKQQSIMRAAASKLLQILLCFTAGAAIVLIILYPSVFRRTGAASVVYQIKLFMSGQPYSAHEHDPNVQCFGDSLTAGTGTTVGHDFPSLLQYLFHRPSRNFGIGGETSTQIKARMLARSRSSEPERVVIWAGRNNFQDPKAVIRDISDMVSSLSPNSQYLILGIINSATETKSEKSYNAIKDLNEMLSQQYKTRFVPIREILAAGTGERNASDTIPAALRFDNIHLNDSGESIVAVAVERALEAHGW